MLQGSGRPRIDSDLGWQWALPRGDVKDGGLSAEQPICVREGIRVVTSAPARGIVHLADDAKLALRRVDRARL